MIDGKEVITGIVLAKFAVGIQYSVLSVGSGIGCGSSVGSL